MSVTAGSTEVLKILAVEDDVFTQKIVTSFLSENEGFRLITACDGQEGWAMYQDEKPDLVVTDWMMPNMDGLELCRRIREAQGEDYVYILILTARSELDNVVRGLDAGADDYVVKPFNRSELIARVRTGARIVSGQKALRRTNLELQDALAHIKTLKGLLPICMDCKKVRDDQDYWREIDEYIRQMTDTEFSHGLCPDCLQKRLAEIDRMEFDLSSLAAPGSPRKQG